MCSDAGFGGKPQGPPSSPSRQPSNVATTSRPSVSSGPGDSSTSLMESRPRNVASMSSAVNPVMVGAGPPFLPSLIHTSAPRGEGASGLTLHGCGRCGGGGGREGRPALHHLQHALRLGAGHVDPLRAGRPGRGGLRDGGWRWRMRWQRKPGEVRATWQGARVCDFPETGRMALQRSHATDGGHKNTLVVRGPLATYFKDMP